MPEGKPVTVHWFIPAELPKSTTATEPRSVRVTTWALLTEIISTETAVRMSKRNAVEESLEGKFIFVKIPEGTIIHHFPFPIYIYQLRHTNTRVFRQVFDYMSSISCNFFQTDRPNNNP